MPMQFRIITGGLNWNTGFYTSKVACFTSSQVSGSLNKFKEHLRCEYANFPNRLPTTAYMIQHTAMPLFKIIMQIYRNNQINLALTSLSIFPGAKCKLVIKRRLNIYISFEVWLKQSVSWSTRNLLSVDKMILIQIMHPYLLFVIICWNQW